MTPAAILERLMQGTSRRPVPIEGQLAAGIAPDDPAALLKLFALAAQAERFRLPVASAAFDDVAIVADNRDIVPQPARAMMRRLVSGKGNPPDDAAAYALAVAMDRMKLRPHPFDLPRLEPFVRKHAERLGPAALAFIAGGQGSGETVSWFEVDQLDETNWTLATPSRKSAYISSLRASDPEGARRLVEGQLPLEKADVRVRLVDALAAGLEAEDRDLLESLTRDRAPNVRQAATRLLARLPGTEAAQAHIQELLSRITAGQAGLLRKRTTLKLQLPANLRSEQAITDWLVANFGAIGSDQFAGALGLSVNALIDGARDDGALVKAIAFSACAARDWPSLRRIVDDFAPDLWADFVQAGLTAFGIVTSGEREAWAAAALSNVARSGAANAWTIASLQQLFEGPLPPPLARAIFQAALRVGGPDILTSATAIMPVELMAEARRSLAKLGQDVAGRATLLADLLLTLNEGPATS